MIPVVCSNPSDSALLRTFEKVLGEIHLVAKFQSPSDRGSPSDRIVGSMGNVRVNWQVKCPHRRRL